MSCHMALLQRSSLVERLSVTRVTEADNPIFMYSIRKPSKVLKHVELSSQLIRESVKFAPSSLLGKPE